MIGFIKYFIMLVFLTGVLFAQDDNDAIGLFRNEFGPGARAMALGGAFAPIAEDFTATYWNPAGLAQIRKMEFYGSLSRINLNNRIGYQGTLTENTNGFTNINSMGIVFPIPTFRGSLVFAVGYNRVNHFDDFNQVVGAPSVSNSSFYQSEQTTVDGNLNQWSFAGAADLSKNFSIGATLNLITGRNRTNVAYREDDPNDVLLDEQSWNVNFDIKPDYTGANFKIGSLFRPMENLRLAATITMPSSISAEENSNYFESFVDDSSYVSDYGPFDEFRKYHITSPWRFELGASYKYKLATLSGSVEFIDWTETRFSSNLVDGNGNNIDGEINTAIITKYRSTENYHLGAEVIIPQVGAKVMGGYYYQLSPYKNGVELVNSNKQFISGGISFLVDEQIKLDVAYQHGFWKQSTTDDFLGADPQGNAFVTSEKIKTNRFLIGLSYRF